MSPLVTKLLYVIVYHEDITEDTNIFLCAISIFGTQILQLACIEEGWQHGQSNSKRVCYNNNWLTFLPLFFLTSCKISAPKKGNGDQKNVNIFKNNALLKSGAGLDHMYTMGWIFF